MDYNLPEDSAISIEYDDNDPTVVIPAKTNAFRYFGGVFLLFWLGGWAFGLVAVSSQLLQGKGGLFNVFWLCGWTVAGFLAAFSAYRIFRPPVPERLRLLRGSIGYDSGIPPLKDFNRGNMDYWGSLFARRRRADIDRRELQTLRLRETDSGNRLTIDIGGERVEIAAQATEIDREWLAGMLARRYHLKQVLPGNADS
ncbi:hypothetical protein JQ604_34515 [Bradyrhizobium jicamae]|uniref:hypothetical protein n=1 Tax=Bradyrhizobium jicamae TaxID=280332 RepID=UPI001BABD831|nr:hypothetical protein [Bradyrhizobium jicamae]MBR0757322.1 hypothetical protein [Bradyrhizobium jicamae]